MKKKILIAYLGNPDFDTRIKNLCYSFSKNNFQISVVGFESENRSITKNETSTVYKLQRKPSVKFYLKFFFNLFNYLRKHKADYYFAEDIYTLGLVCVFAKSRGKKLFYNSRELYPFLAGLRNRKYIQFLIALIEKVFIKFPDFVLTTGEMDADFLIKHYSLKNVIVLRNLPLYINEIKKHNLHELLKIPEDSKIFLYQGVLLDGRGIRFAIEIVKEFENIHLVILGDGEKKIHFQEFAESLRVESRVHFLGSFSQDELINYTSACDIGLALIENISMSYYYALPGKLFEYIMAEIPVICSDLPQMKKIVRQFNVGRFTNIDDKENLMKIIKELITNNGLNIVLRDNCKLAKKELNWEKEFEKLLEKVQ